MTLVTVISAVALLALLVLLGKRAARKEHNDKLSGVYADAFVWVEDDGRVVELDAANRNYLNTDFHPGDGGRPYIKSSYESRTPDGKIGGFLKRSKIPNGMSVFPIKK